MVFKKCKCGSTDFYDDDEGGGTWRCEECGRLAEFTSSKKTKESNESIGDKNDK